MNIFFSVLFGVLALGSFFSFFYKDLRIMGIIMGFLNLMMIGVIQVFGMSNIVWFFAIYVFAICLTLKRFKVVHSFEIGV